MPNDIDVIEEVPAGRPAGGEDAVAGGKEEFVLDDETAVQVEDDTDAEAVASEAEPEAAADAEPELGLEAEPEGEEDETDAGDDDSPGEEADEVDAGQLARLIDAGYAPEFAAQLQKAGLAELALVEVDRRQVENLRGAPPPPPDMGAPGTPPDQPAKVELGLDPELFDPGVIEALETSVGKIQQQFAERVRALEAQLAQRDAAAFTQRFDQRLQTLGDEWEEVLGKEPITALSQQDPKFANRSRVIETMRLLAQDAANRGKVVTEDELFQRALRIEFADTLETRARDSVRAEVRKRQKMKTVRPTQRQPEKVPMTPEQRALMSMAKIAKERGIDIDTSVGDYAEEL